MKLEIFTTMGNYGRPLYSTIKCPFCEIKFLNIYQHFTRSNCGCKLVEDILKSKGKEFNGRKKAILNGWCKKK